MIARWWIASLFRVSVLALSLLSGSSTAALGEETAPIPGSRKVLTVEDAINTTRAMSDVHGQTVFVSPDGDKYFIFLISGSTNRNRVVGRLMVGSLTSLAKAQPKQVAYFQTDALGAGSRQPFIFGPPYLSNPGGNVPVWVDNQHVALRWTDHQNIIQVFSVDVGTMEARQITDEPSSVYSFAVGPAGDLILDRALVHDRTRSSNLQSQGYSVKNGDLIGLLGGWADGTSMYQFGMCETRLLKAGQSVSRSLSLPPLLCNFSLLASAQDTRRLFSPDGGRAVLSERVTDDAHLRDWSVLEGVDLQTSLAQFRADPNGSYALRLHRLVWLDLESGVVHPLVSAPLPLRPVVVAWSPDNQHVIVGPVYAIGAGDAGLRGRAVLNIDVRSNAAPGSVPLPELEKLTSAHWSSASAVCFEVPGGRTIALRLGQSGRSVPPTSLCRSGPKKMGRPIHVEVRQTMNVPPRYYAVAQGPGKERLILDPNAGLDHDFLLGRVENISWPSRYGGSRRGRLYLPADFRRGKRFPLVVQLHGYDPGDTFSLYGRSGPTDLALGPGYSVYLAQILASRGIGVLQVDEGSWTSASSSEFDQLKQCSKAIAEAVEYLIREGLVERSRVGLMGHSASGRVVEYALASGIFPYAAAIADDYADTNYVSEAALNWRNSFGPPPFGTELARWLNNSPAFHVEQIRTPLQIIISSPSGGTAPLIYSWEVFSRLRFLNKPVEYYVVPDFEHGSHVIQNPRQLSTVQNRALDWWRFWLLDDPEIEASAKYSDWRRLKALHERDLERPVPLRLQWKANPLPAE